MAWELWLGFAVGVLARWGDRIQFVVSETEERTWKEFFKKNAVRLAIRAVVTTYIFYVVFHEGWVTNQFISFSVGLSADHIMESFLDRAKRTGESLFTKKPEGEK